MLLILTLLLAGAAVYLLACIIIPIIEQRRAVWHARKEQDITDKLDKMFYYDKSTQYIIWLYYILPVVFGVFGWVFFGHELFAIVGVIIGLAIPSLILKIKEMKRRAKFNLQILDAVMILSSSLKGGLSLLQGLEVIMEEMPVPISQEIGLVVRENKMGLNLEDSLKHLKSRMNNEELSLMINSLLVARETGGDLIKVLSRLSVTIRDNRKLKDSIQTLTMQGKLQGVIMSVLPFFFIWWTSTFEKHHFDIMFQNETGKILVGVAIVLQLVGMFLIRKFSIIKV